jgi:hypothetical protein
MAKEMVDITEQLEAKGYVPVLIGLGSKRVAKNFAEYMHFKGEAVVDESQESYQKMGFSQQTEMVAGYNASNEAAEMLRLKGVKATTFLIGGGLLSAGQNGGVLVVSKGGESIPFAYRSTSSADMPAGSDLLAKL